MKNVRRLFSQSRDRSRSITPGTGDNEDQATPSSPHEDLGYSSPGPSGAPPESTPGADDLWEPSFPSTYQSDLRPKTHEYHSLPLPPDSIASKAESTKHHPLAARRLEEMMPLIKARRDVALAAKEREIANGAKPDRVEGRRGGSKPDSKQPPRGMRAIIRWNNNSLPVGAWSTRFNNYIGVLVRRASIINPFYKFRELPWSSYEEIWSALMDCFCLEDFDGAWNYIFNIKVEVTLKQWRHEIKRATYDRYSEDWQRFLNLDERVDDLHFTALLMYWDTEAAQNKSTKGAANRRKKLHDHHLGAHSYANMEDSYCRDTGKSIMPINLKAKLAYGTFRDQYRADRNNELKIQANLDLVEGFEAATKEAAALHMPQEGSPGEPDPHLLTPEDNITLTQNLLGYNRRGRYPLYGVGASPGINTRSYTASSMPYTAAGAGQSNVQAMPVVFRVTSFLRGKIDAETLVQVTTELSRVVLRARSMDEVMSLILNSLAGVIPADLFLDAMQVVNAGDDNTRSAHDSAQAGDTRGSSSRPRTRGRDEDGG